MQEASKVGEILRGTFKRIDTSQPIGISRIFCDLLKYFTTELLNDSEQITLSHRLLEQGILDIVLDLLATDSIDLGIYVDLLTLTVTLLTTPKEPTIIENKYNINENKLSKIVNSLFTAVHNALNAQLSDRADFHNYLYPITCQCLSHLRSLSQSFHSVRLMVISSLSFLYLIVRDDGSVTLPIRAVGSGAAGAAMAAPLFTETMLALWGIGRLSSPTFHCHNDNSRPTFYERPTALLPILSCLHSVLKMSIDNLKTLKSSLVYTLLDELILKLGQKDKKIASKSIQSIYILILNCTQLQPDRLSKRYKGVSPVLKRWLGNDFDEILMEVLFKLDPSIRFEDEGHTAARVIQAYWRGYQERKRLIQLRKVVLDLQSRIRFKKWTSVFNRRCEKAKFLKYLMKSDQIRDYSIRQQTEVFKTVEKLPAYKIQSYFEQQQEIAAITIQNGWRNHKSREILVELRKERERYLETSVITIQRAFRKYLLKKQTANLSEEKKYNIDEEIRNWRESYKSDWDHSVETLNEQQKKVNEILKQHHGYPESCQRLQNCQDIMKKIKRSFDLLINASEIPEVPKPDLEIYSIPKTRTEVLTKSKISKQRKT